jgi:hypothetical protein
MERANPADMRKAMNMVRALSEAGILFIPMPVANREEFETLAAAAWEKLDEMSVEAERDEE